MSADEPTDDEGSEGTEPGTEDPITEDGIEGDDGTNVRERLEQEADRAVEGFDEGLVDLLSWVLETETRARIYVYLRQNPESTSDEIAEGTGLYPSTVREALAELHDEEKVERGKRESDGAGNNPYEYSAMAPSELVGSVVDDVQAELNTVFNLDRYLGDENGQPIETPEDEPVTITVEDAEGADSESGDDNDSEDTESADNSEDAEPADGSEDADASDRSGADDE